MGVTIGGASQSGYVTFGGEIQGGGSSGEYAPLFFGGSCTTTGNKMRTNGKSNESTFSSFDAGSEWPMPKAGTLTRVSISRTNTTSDVTFDINLDGSSATTVTILAGNSTQSFDISEAATIGQTVSVEYDSTAGSAPDFCTAVVWWV